MSLKDILDRARNSSVYEKEMAELSKNDKHPSMAASLVKMAHELENVENRIAEALGYALGDLPTYIEGEIANRFWKCFSKNAAPQVPNVEAHPNHGGSVESSPHGEKSSATRLKAETPAAAAPQIPAPPDGWHYELVKDGAPPIYPGLWEDAALGQTLEGIIALRTHFTGEPPYVGNDGVVLALNEALDAAERDRKVIET